MGGGSYDRDYGDTGGSSGSFNSGGTSSSASKSAMRSSYLDEAMDPNKRTIVTNCKYPILVFLDVTGSNHEFARIVYDKAPVFFGQIEQQGYLEKGEFEMSFCAVGDACCDSAPLQIADFASGTDIDTWLERMYLEGQGGGQGTETYELAAYYAQHNIKMDNAVMPFCFFIGDEALNLNVDPDHISDVIGGGPNGRDLGEVRSKEVFKSLLKKFGGRVFYLQNEYQGGGWPDETKNMNRIWRTVLPAENVISIREEKGIIDLILGIIAMYSKTRDLAGYIKDMKGRGQTTTRIDSITASLKDMSGKMLPTGMITGNLPSSPKKKFGSTSKRL